MVILLAYMGGYFEGIVDYDSLVYLERRYLELGIWGRRAGVEGYSLLSSDFDLRRMHLSFSGSFYSLALFQGEDRHYLPSPLLYLVSPERIRDESWGPHAGGLRLDLWKGNYSGTFILSRSSVTEYAVYRLGEIRKHGGILTAGGGFLEKDWFSGRNRVVYGRIFLKRKFSLGIEAARCLEHPDGEGDAGEIELRIPRLGPFYLKTSLYKYDDTFRDELSWRFSPWGGREYGRRGIRGEWVFMVPGRMMNITVRWDRYENLWHMEEIYCEFIGGIHSKIFLETIENEDGIWRHAFFETGGEWRKGKVRFQFKVKDIQTEYERYLFGVEAGVNLPLDFSLYLRHAVGENKERTWESTFLQIAWRGAENTEVFLEYGEWWHTDYGLLNDGDFADNPYIQTPGRMRCILRFWF